MRSLIILVKAYTSTLPYDTESLTLSPAGYGVINNVYRETVKGDEDAPVVSGTYATTKVGSSEFVSAPSVMKLSPSIEHISAISSAIGVLRALMAFMNSSSVSSCIFGNECDSEWMALS